MEKEIELLPCPFCGSMPIEEYSGSWLVVTCSDDSCVLGNMAITTIGWNRRATTDREKRLVEALEHYADESFWDDPHPDLEYAKGSLYNYVDEFDGLIPGYDIAAKTLAAHKGEK